MKLYRAHTEAFEAKIASNDAFVIDESRRFNRVPGKNRAGLYFYALKEAGVYDYIKIYDDWGRVLDVCNIYIYEIDNDVNLLDLRHSENRRLVMPVAEFLYKKHIEELKNMLFDYRDFLADAKSEKDKKRWHQLISDLESEIKSTTVDFILETPKFWGQMCTDFEAGVIMRKCMERLGVDGIIITDRLDLWDDEAEVVLLKPARRVGMKKPDIV